MNSHVCKRSNFSHDRGRAVFLHLVRVCDVEEIVVHVKRSAGALEVRESWGIVSEGHVLRAQTGREEGNGKGEKEGEKRGNGKGGGGTV